MVSIAKIFKAILNVNNVVIDNIELAVTDNGVKVLKIDLHPTKAHANRCPHCGNTFLVKKRSLSTWVKNDFDYTTKCCKSPLHEMQWREIGLCQNTMEAEALAKSSRKRWKPMSSLAEHLGIVVWTAGTPLRTTKTFKF